MLIDWQMSRKHQYAQKALTPEAAFSGTCTARHTASRDDQGKKTISDKDQAKNIWMEEKNG